MAPRERPAPHAVPCEGLQQIQRLQAVLETRVNGIEEWQRRANGNIHDAVNKIDHVQETVNLNAGSRHVQITALDKSISEKFMAQDIRWDARFMALDTQIRTMLLTALALAIPIIAGLAYILFTHGIAP